MCRGGKYYKYKQVFLFAQALHIKLNVSLQYLVLKKQKHFCSRARLMKSALFRIILLIINPNFSKAIHFNKKWYSSSTSPDEHIEQTRSSRLKERVCPVVSSLSLCLRPVSTLKGKIPQQN